MAGYEAVISSLADLWDRLFSAQPVPPRTVILVTGVVALLGVLVRPAWRLTRNFITIAHEGGHALMAHLMGAAMELQKVTIVSRGDALGYAFYLPEEDRYLHTKEELVDRMVVALAGRAAEEVVFGRVTNGAANDLEKVTEIARSMVFEWGMADSVSSRTLRADNYALSEETKRLRDSEQALLTDAAYEEALRLLQKHRVPLDRLAASLLEKETLVRDEVVQLLADVEAESRAADSVGVPRVVAAKT